MGCLPSSDQGPKTEAVHQDHSSIISNQLAINDPLSNAVEIHVSCTNLVNKDTMSKSDPFAVLYTRNKHNGNWTEINRTEVIEDSLNPSFVKSIITKYYFEEQQQMKIEVYDADKREELKDLSKQEFTGEAEFMMHTLVRAQSQILQLDLTSKSKKAGVVKLHVEQIKQFSSDKATFKVEGLAAKSSAVLFYRLLRSDDSATLLPVYQSESIKSVKDVVNWKRVNISTGTLYRGDDTKTLQIELYEYSSSGNHKLVGSTTFKFRDIIDGYKWQSSVATIVFKDVKVEKRSSFLEYIFNGCQISLAVAIDFTGSNGDPRDSSSLHNLNPATNQYMRAIRAIGSILQEYDSDKNIPVFGFGAQIAGFSETSHCFALNGNIFAPEVYTINGVLDVYSKNLHNMSFSGPTNFADVIKYIGDYAGWHVARNHHHNYFVLLILTDGMISDLCETIDEIVRCSELPISVIITGVGSCDFRDMDKLDADINPLCSKKLNKCSKRDIVQFVPFSKFEHNPQEMARQTLAELPRQLVDYMTQMRIPSRAPMVSYSGPSFSDERKSGFVQRVMQLSPGMNCEAMVQAGFPVENPNVFMNAMRMGYKNVLAN